MGEPRDGGSRGWLRYLGEGKRLQQNLKLIALGVVGLSLFLIRVPEPVASTGATVVEQEQSTTSEEQFGSKTQGEERELEERLEAMLSQIAGAGSVDVTVKLDGSSTSNFASNESVDRRVTDENDKSGGRRVTTENNLTDQLVVVQAATGRQEAVLEREVAPDVVGVLVVAEGARNPRTKAELFRAAATALGVEPHKIVVLPKKF